MRVALFTPFSPDSTMGKYAKLILPALACRHEVHVWCPQSTHLIETEVPVISFEAGLAVGDPRLDKYEMLVYQIGNDASHFLPILELANHRPGIHILHDYTMNPLLAHYYLSVLRQPVAYVRLMDETYGEWARKYAEDTIIGRKRGIWDTEELFDYPLFEPLLANALGVVVHSEFHLAAVRRAFSGPAAAIKLALSPLPAPTGLSRSELGVPDDRLLIVSTGYMGKSKLLDVTISALGKCPELASRVTFAIVGKDCPIEGPKLRTMVRDLQLEDTVRFIGYQPESRLHEWIEHADICVNLRRPTGEGASLSVLEQMLHGKATVVLPNGFYAELPPDTVVRADPSNLDNLHELLLRLANDVAWRAEVGANAREFVSTGFDPADYAGRLADLISDAHAQMPISLLKQRVSFELTRMGRVAEELVGPDARMEIQRLFYEGECSAKSTDTVPTDNC